MSLAVDLRARPWTHWVTLGCRLLLGIVLLCAGLSKVIDLEQSVIAVRAYRFPGLPFAMTSIIGYALPILEIAVGLALIVGLFTRLAAIGGALFMVAFVIAISSAWARGLSIDCGCFGAGGEIDPERALAQYPWEIARDIGLFITGLWMVFQPHAPFAVDQWLFAPIAVSDGAAETD